VHGSAQARQIQHAQQALQGMSVPFEANSGQFDPAVAFTGRTFAGAIHVTRQGQIVYSLAAPTQQQGVTSAPPPEMPPQAPPKKPPRTPAGTKPQAPPQTPPATRPLSGWSLTETLAGALPLSPTGGEAAATQITRFSGPHSYQPATYRNLHLGQAWPGVQVELAMRGANVEKLFHVAPQADPGQIQVRVDGALSLRLGKGGELIAATGHGDVAYTAPVAFQEVTGQRVEVPVQYALNSQGDGYGFALGAYDRALPLVIDPLLQSTYLGGDGDSTVLALVIAPSGEVLVGGITADNSSLGAFPGTAGGAQPSTGGTDGFIARLSADLRTLEQSTYLGGSGQNSVIALAISPSGEVLATGITSSTDFPGTADGAQSVAAGGFYDGFIARLSADLRTLEQSTYLGGSQFEDLYAMAIAPTGEVLVAGSTSSTQFPGTAGGAQPVAAGGGNDGFVARLSADLRTLAQSTYLGGAGYNVVQALTIAPSGDVLAGGYTDSIHFPGTAGGAQSVNNGGFYDGFIARLSASLRTLEQSTYLGGTDMEAISTLAIAPSGEVLVGGLTYSRNFPGAAGGAQPGTNSSGVIGFITRLSADLRAVSPQTITFAPQASQVLGSPGSTFTIDPPAMASSGLPVDYGSATPAICTVSGTTVTMLDDGICTLVARQAGNAQWQAADANADVRIRRAQAIRFPAQASRSFEAGTVFAIDPPATASSGLPVEYASTTPGICTVSGNRVTMAGEGICTVTASQPGDARWMPATGVAQDIELTAVVPPPVTPPVIPPVTPPVTPPVPPPAPAPIPALGAWPLALLGAMAAGFGAHALRRRGVFSARQIPAPRLRTGRHRSSGSC
jgi:hypothetical protein